MLHAALIIKHIIVGGIKDALLYNNIRLEMFHGIPFVKEPVRIMPESRSKKGKTGRSFPKSEAVSISKA